MGRVKTCVAQDLFRAYRTVYVYQVRNRIDLEMSVQLLAGAGGVHITPPIGFPMGVYGARHQSAQGDGIANSQVVTMRVAPGHLPTCWRS